ncbi:hypothetical protein Tdes44962_MAKER08691, partial [Teratosphaeria destructans]
RRPQGLLRRAPHRLPRQALGGPDRRRRQRHGRGGLPRSHPHSRLAVSESAGEFEDLGAALRHGIAVPVVSGLAAQPRSHPAPRRSHHRRSRRAPDVPLGRVVVALHHPVAFASQQRRQFGQSISHHESQQHHGQLQHVAHLQCRQWIGRGRRVGRTGPDLLCGLSTAVGVEGQLCLHELHLRALRELRRGHHQWAVPRPDEHVSAVQRHGQLVQAVPVGHSVMRGASTTTIGVTTDDVTTSHWDRGGEFGGRGDVIAVLSIASQGVWGGGGGGGAAQDTGRWTSRPSTSRRIFGRVDSKRRKAEEDRGRPILMLGVGLEGRCIPFTFHSL